MLLSDINTIGNVRCLLAMSANKEPTRVMLLSGLSTIMAVVKCISAKPMATLANKEPTQAMSPSDLNTCTIFEVRCLLATWPAMLGNKEPTLAMSLSDLNTIMADVVGTVSLAKDIIEMN